MITSADASHLIRSNLAEPELQPFLETYVQGLPAQATELTVLMADRDLQSLRLRVHNLRGSGGLYGLMPISDVAGNLEQLIHDEVPIDEIRVKVMELIDVLQRVEGFGAVATRETASA